MRANLRWKLAGDAPVSKVAVAAGDGGALVADERRRVHLLDAAGKVLWTREHEEAIRAVRMPAEGRGGVVLAIRELTRYGVTGKAIWSVAPPPLAVDLALRRDGSAIAATGEQGLVRLYASNGKELRARRLFHAADFVAIPDQSGEVIVVSRRGDVSVLGGPESEPLWHVNLGCEAWRPDVSKDRVVVPSYDGVHAFLLDGTPAGIYDVGAPCQRAQVAAAGALLLVQDIRKRLLLLDAASGETVWHVELTEEPRDVALSADGRNLVVATRDGGIEAFELARAQAPQPARRAAGAFLEVADAPAAAKLQPRLRWRVKTPPLAAAEIVVAKAGVALLDREAGVVSFWTGGERPAWTAGDLGSRAKLAAARAGHPIVVAGERGIRFYAADGALLAESPVVARQLAVADSGLAVLAGSDVARLHLFDGTGRALWDVPTNGFSEIGISPRGMEIALAQADGRVTFHVRGQRTTWTSDLTPDASSEVRVLPRPPVGFRETPLLHAEPDARIAVLDDGVAFGTRDGRAGFVAPDGRIVFEARVAPIEQIVRAGRSVLLRDASGAWHRVTRDPWAVTALPEGPKRSPGAVSRFAEAAAPVDSLLEFRYDSSEICCLDAGRGEVLWRRALDRLPLAMAVADDGLSLAAHVSGELVLYDLAPASASAAPRFLEL